MNKPLHSYIPTYVAIADNLKTVLLECMFMTGMKIHCMLYEVMTVQLHIN